jgi:hypothetical protein
MPVHCSKMLRICSQYARQQRTGLNAVPHSPVSVPVVPGPYEPARVSGADRGCDSRPRVLLPLLPHRFRKPAGKRRDRGERNPAVAHRRVTGTVAPANGDAPMRSGCSLPVSSSQSGSTAIGVLPRKEACPPIRRDALAGRQTDPFSAGQGARIGRRRRGTRRRFWSLAGVVRSSAS